MLNEQRGLGQWPAAGQWHSLSWLQLQTQQRIFEGYMFMTVWKKWPLTKDENYEKHLDIVTLTYNFVYWIYTSIHMIHHWLNLGLSFKTDNFFIRILSVKESDISGMILMSKSVDILTFYVSLGENPVWSGSWVSFEELQFIWTWLTSLIDAKCWTREIISLKCITNFISINNNRNFNRWNRAYV